MSLVQPPSRKRKRNSFNDWNGYLQESTQVFQHAHEEEDAAEQGGSVLVLDSDVETGSVSGGNNYQFKKGTSVAIEEDEYESDFKSRDGTVDVDDDEVVFIKEVPVTQKPSSFSGVQFNNSFARNENIIMPPVHVGLKKRRTNSLPQLPLSQLCYRRVSETFKIGEIKPNLVIKQQQQVSSNAYSVSTSHSIPSSSSYDSSSSSSTIVNTNNNPAFYSDTSSSLSPVPTAKPQRITDENGYYIANPGDSFANDRFKVIGTLGQGTFGKVIKAYEVSTKETVAIKIIRAIPKYREASKIELRVLTTLKNADPENLNHCIHLREVLDYENHICIITDLLDISLYEFLQKNHFKPFPGSQIQAITRQLIRSVAFLHDLKLIHTDLKPENILLTDSGFFKKKNKLLLKNPLINVIDFGSAIFNDEYHSELVSTRHYRAPEIVLGLGWSFPCDMWSLGCILVELVTGEALFNTHENSEHLAIMEKVIGEKIPLGIINRIPSASVKHQFFKKDPNSSYSWSLQWPKIDTSVKSRDFVASLKKIDQLICSRVKKPKLNIDIKLSLTKNWELNKHKHINIEIFKFWYYFIDLVYKCLKYDPARRITAIEALNHKWWDYGIMDEGTDGIANL